MRKFRDKYREESESVGGNQRKVNGKGKVYGKVDEKFKKVSKGFKK